MGLGEGALLSRMEAVGAELARNHEQLSRGETRFLGPCVLHREALCRADRLMSLPEVTDLQATVAALASASAQQAAAARD